MFQLDIINYKNTISNMIKNNLFLNTVNVTSIKTIPINNTMENSTDRTGKYKLYGRAIHGIIIE